MYLQIGSARDRFVGVEFAVEEACTTPMSGQRIRHFLLSLAPQIGRLLGRTALQ
jgi:hypothetical protein